jgi:glyceraldehyde 3-phosphate dehydrogenase
MSENARVAINGLGRIGRAALKLIVEDPRLELAAVNELGSLENMAYLLKYDTVYGRYDKDVEINDGALVVDGCSLAYLSQRNPDALPWGDLGIDLVFECTGRFTEREEAERHLKGGAQRVVLSGPTKSPDIPTVVRGVNAPDGDSAIISCASCTTNNVTPIVEILDRHFGIQKALMTTVHGYTATQALVDAPGGRGDMRRGRAAAQNLVPSSTGAAHATANAYPSVKGAFDGVAVRAPVVDASISDVVTLLTQDTNVQNVNEAFRDEAGGSRYSGVLGVTEDPLVSSDIIRDPRASIVQLDLTRVVGGNLAKVMSWYDNEWGFTNQMVQVGVDFANL